MRLSSLRPYVMLMLLFVMPTALIAQGNKSGATAPATSIKYQGKTIQLNEHALYVNAKLKKESRGPYTFGSLQELAANAKSGTEATPTVVYLEPDVYWTDDPKSDNAENHLIGLLLPQANITMIGLSDNPEHTIIAGNRGQMAGSRGNWNVIGLGNAFHAYNITFGNYCNVDLVYGPDPSKSYPKRQTTITQAQTITNAGTERADKWLFENCRFVSFLNLLAGRAHREFFDKCFFQCTDDAIGSGDVTVYRNCTFNYYANHPSPGGSTIIQAYLGCRFVGMLRDAGANATVYYAKRNAAFPTIDGVFEGNIGRLEWTNVLNDDVRQYVYHNTLHGKPVAVSAARPDLSVTLTPETLKPYKVGAEYNIYNLLRENDDWDPAGQKLKMAAYGNLAFRLNLRAAKPKLKAGESTPVSYIIYPERVKTTTPVKWSVSDAKILSLTDNGDGAVTVTGHNATEQTQRAYVQGITAGGIVGVAYIDVVANPLPAPALASAFKVNEPANGSISVDYALSNIGKRADVSLISWYRATSAQGTDTIPVAVSRLNKPLKTYPLTTGDVGYYLVAKIEPKHATSLAGSGVMAISRKITAKDVSTKNIHTDFQNIAVQRSVAVRNGWWTLDTYRPADIGAEFEWQPGTGSAWTYGPGDDGTADRIGLVTVARGARLLYAQDGTYGDMAVTVKLSPHKVSGQGFGSATGQYADVYIKFDAKTLTGYGLRIQRTPAYGEGVKFTLYKFVNGASTPIGKEVYSSAFVPGCVVKLNVKGNLLSANVTSTTPQQQIQKDEGLVHEVNLSATIDPNTFGGAGLQHTGTVSPGNRLMLQGFDIDY
ncbi:hypothetical protein C8P68_102572 [Mucilaginibacter yixingensis]|uniref:Pectinesterase n=1 Tax=Mucilaginibacter yixingensis TaxID=1295612 RepID=A0A2T5JD96_9SPHI|nr:hypothetical protein [Mucilaginibacter yixingensis]PTQ99742.1 hypothetical protein C8P68_102572 [Mucilaginibacter yixingensis]